MNGFDFYRLEEAALTAEQFRLVQTEILEMSNEELGAALGYDSRERGRKMVSQLRSGKSIATPPIVTAMWMMAYSDEKPAWAGGDK